jgi:two-component system cell cycle sensor histidine kinase/response regulator CckA
VSTEPRPPAQAGAASPDAYLALVAEHSSDLVAILDRDARIRFASPSFQRILGYRPDDLVGASLFAYLHSADLASMIEQWSQFAASGAIELSCRLRDAGGAWRWLNLAVRASADPCLLVAVAQDVTERRQAEQLLARLLRHNDLTLNAIGEGVFGIDPHGNATFVNAAAARMLGWEPLQLLGRPIHTLLFGPDAAARPADESAAILSTARDGRVHRVAETCFWRSDGDSFPVDYVCTPVVQSGEVVGAVVVFRDLTERKALEAQFLHAQKMESIGKLASGIAHDFNNLLTGIVGYATMAAMLVGPGGPVYESLQEIEKSGFRAADLTRQLLAFARKQPLNPRLMLLNDLLLDTDKLLRRLVGGDVQLLLQLDPDLAPVRADPGQMSQVLVNLAVNARDAMPAGGALTLQTANVVVEDAGTARLGQLPPGPYVCLTVRDTGVGIPPEVLPRLFEPFFTTKAPGEGTGLGLATCYGIVQQHHGAILVTSAPGQGATFEIYLPQAELGDEYLGPAPVYDIAPPRGSERILVAEDDDTVRRLVVSLLREAGYTVREAADGEAALRLVHDDQPFDLLLADIVLPRLRGPALASRIGALSPATRVLYTSGHVDDAIVQHGQLAPGVQFLPKPFSAADLLRKVRQVLDA